MTSSPVAAASPAPTTRVRPRPASVSTSPASTRLSVIATTTPGASREYGVGQVVEHHAQRGDPAQCVQPAEPRSGPLSGGDRGGRPPRSLQSPAGADLRL